MLRFAVLCLILVSTAFGADPLTPEFSDALQHFHAEGTKFWGFTQATTTHSQSFVERYEPWKPEAQRWTLLQKDGHAPTADDLKEYNDRLSRRGGGDTAPDITRQLDRSTAEHVSDDAQTSIYRFHLKPGNKDDSSAQYMVATFT